MDKKYEMIKEGDFYRIRALRDFSVIKKGELGGLIESESNLSHNDDCWVYESAKVYGNAVICWNAAVYGTAEVYGNAKVYGNAEVYGTSEVYGNARVYGDAWVFENAEVYGNAQVYGNAKVYGNVKVYGDARVYGDTEVSGSTRVQDIHINNNSQFIFILSEPYAITVTYAYIYVGCMKITLDQIDDDFSHLVKDKETREYIRTIVKVALDRILKTMGK